MKRFLLFASLCFALASEAQVQLPAEAPECVRWAASELEASLRAMNLHLARTSVVVRIAPSLVPSSADSEEPPGSLKREQTFTLSVEGATVHVDAGGATGAMYGLQEIVEQVSALEQVQRHPYSWAEALRLLKPGTQRPFLEIRADNPFIHVYPILLNDLPMWRSYIDMLARNRFNLLDLHGAYDLSSTSFPNLYPQLITVPGYETAGGFTQEYRAKNLADFKAILAYANSRGVRVSFMNYSANDNKGGIYKTDPNVTNVPAAKLADYTAKAVTMLIRELPGLYMLGFRVGESMQPASFYKEAYIKGVEDAGRRDLRLYTRSWQTTKEQLEPIAQAAHNGFDIEIKFNGEHLGLPYQSMQGPAYGSYSYQGYLDRPADYQIIWQIRANGTHRFWAWEDTGFIRRTVKACALGNARGFTLEPHTAYFDVHAENYYRSAADVAVYPYIWQKHWMWYYAWGRLGFDPELSEDHLRRKFSHHYGAAGDAAYAAMQASGAIVPLAYAYRFVGPDQRDFSPETETGNFDPKAKRARQDILQFAENTPEDPRTFAGIDVFVRNKLAGGVDGRYGPFAVAGMFQAAVAGTRSALNSAPAVQGRAAEEFRLLRDDLLFTTYFGEYYAHRIQGMAYLDYAVRSGRHEELGRALRELASSRESWKQLGSAADAVYRPLSNPLRKQTGFQWSAENDRLAKLDATADSFWAAHKAGIGGALSLSDADEGKPTGFSIDELGHQLKNGVATIRCRPTAPAGIASVLLWWKPLPSELQWQSSPMQRGADGTFSASFPVDAHGAMYMVEVTDTQAHAKNFPDERIETPYRVIPASVASK